MLGELEMVRAVLRNHNIHLRCCFGDTSQAVLCTGSIRAAVLPGLLHLQWFLVVTGTESLIWTKDKNGVC